MSAIKKSTQKKSTPAKPALSQRAVAKKAVVKKAGAKRAGAKRADANRAADKKAVGKKPTSRKSATKKSTTKESATTKSPTGKAAARKAAAPSVRRSLSTYRAKRNFDVTAEPSGNKPVRKGKALVFVIQKHDASHLHFDLRLEVDGVMKSWAVPKGPNLAPEVKRLAMEVEDHPMAYNKFEGTIPQGEYGGGTVMLWDRGTYSPDEINPGETENDAARRALDAGKLAFTFHGTRLKGSFALVRTRLGEGKPQWLLIKHKDQYAKAGRDIVAEVMTSVSTGRRMEAIAAGKKPRATKRSGE